MKKPTCQTCPFWDGIDDDEGTCHRHAPQPTVNSAATRLRGDNAVPEWPAWPITDRTNFCGEHPDFPAYLALLRTPG